MPKAAITRVGNFQVDPNYTRAKDKGLYPPKLTTAQRDAIPVGTLTNAAIIFNTTIGLYQFYQNAAWYTMNGVLGTVGVGLVAGSTPIILPSGPSAAVELAANNVAGFIYYNTTLNTVKLRTNAAWVTVTVA